MKTSKSRTSSAKPSRYIAGIAPLLLSLVVSQAYALDRTVTGANGVVGTPGTTTSPNGGKGGAAPDLTDTSLTAGAFNRLTLTGGNGGMGGAGLPGALLDPDSPDCRDFGICQYGPSGIGGNGGAGAAATGRVNAASLIGAATAEANVFGGHGGLVGEGDPYAFGIAPTSGHGGAGGNASSVANAVSVSGAVSAKAYATGGNGGATNVMFGGRGGDGGKATARASASSVTGNVSVLAQATGGNGGSANNVYGPSGAGAAVYLENMVAGATRGALSLLQHAIGGNGGEATGAGGPPDLPPAPTNNVGGNAGSVLRLSDSQASALKGTVSAKGGNAGGYTGIASPAAGNGRAELYLTSTRAGTNVDGSVTAIGGDITNGIGFGGVGGDAGSATAIASLTGKAAVSGTAEAKGGQFGGLAAGSATSLLTINAGGLATGTARAVGGQAGGWLHSWEYQDGDASATLELVGAGASGGSYAQGANANSNVNVTTTGARAVNVESRAIAGLGDEFGQRGNKGDAKASTVVNAGTTGGRAAVTAGAYAFGNRGSQNAQANLLVNTGGDITGTAQAEGGVFSYFYTVSGNADAVARGVTSGAHSVNLSAVARSTFAPEPHQNVYGKSTASAYGASGSGVVTVAAQALSGMNYSSPANRSSARATAETSLAGGVSNASARASGEQMEAVATANAIGAKGTRVGFTATTTGDYAQGSAVASNRFDAASFALKTGTGAAGDNQLNTYAGAAPADGAALGLSATAAAAMTDLYGTGMHGASGGIDPEQASAPVGENVSEFQFVSTVDQHLLIAFLGAGGTGFDSLDLSISSHGNLLFSQSFTSLSDANLFFTDKVLDLGLFGAGAQDIVVRSSLAGAAYGYAFNYVLGGGVGGLIGAGNPTGGVGVSAVPEESTWMMMMIGLSGLVIVARRRKSVAARA
jgi:hypothetical protein